MRQTSLKRAAQLLEYSKLRKHYLARVPLCEVCRDRRPIDVHHRRGRQGKLLLDQSQWLAVCRVCHDKIHQEPAWARQKGYR